MASVLVTGLGLTAPVNLAGLPLVTVLAPVTGPAEPLEPTVDAAAIADDGIGELKPGIELKPMLRSAPSGKAVELVTMSVPEDTVVRPA